MSEPSTPHLQQLLTVMQQLRDPDKGCPWDVKQTMASLVKYTLEEAHEVADAIHRGDAIEIRDELGDLLFQVMFYAQIAQEDGLFGFDDVAKAITDKLVRRHPHVFTESANDLSDDALQQQWEAIKLEEKRQKKPSFKSVFDSLKRGVPAFTRAYEMQQACAKVGFDWPEPLGVLDKIAEEVEEVRHELQQPTHCKAAIEEELGDLLFACVNLARHLSVDPEQALTKANLKFETRFNHIENTLLARGSQFEEMSLAQLEELWKEAKQTLKTRD
ncbi:nucleoside triphosphate pyrophosphohydrolase [Alteromonas facilis]|uniref:nucleoside triphosphate pyrophosphohydrolase n=1 Tax=Alteromonas facilis TaxID=2048004 RepID=UPI000C292BA1|nr:nucleoside triphosphate pyrophosphohydrolase [Alteromonas facilis]